MRFTPRSTFAVPRSALANLRLPAICPDDCALLLALQWQLEQSQWWSTERIAAAQLGQLHQLLAHAAAQSDFHAPRLRAAGFDPAVPLSWDVIRRIPVMRRADLQRQPNSVHSRTLPRGHGARHSDATSGSTFEPVAFFTSDIGNVFWHAFTLREHLWHERVFSGSLAAIRSVLTTGATAGWGPPVEWVFETGPGWGLRVSTAVREQVDWLLERDPDYLITYPSNLLALAQAFAQRGRRLPSLRQLRTFGERLPVGLREECDRAFGVPLVDLYSAQEVGYIALQCPVHEHYHVQSENVLLEILDESDRPCPPGSAGRVVVTALHNFATPFIRYDLGDYAALGAACDCGRGLPVLERILGRARNMAVLPDGDHFWPRIRAAEWGEIADVRRFRLVQVNLHDMRLDVVSPAPLDAAQIRALGEHVQIRLGHPFAVRVNQVDAIEPGPAHKFDDFICELSAER